MTQEYIPDEYIDPKIFNSDLLPHWKTLITNDNALIGTQLQQLVSSFVYLPSDDLYQIVVSYLMISQKWSKVVPIMFCYGLPGSGKSTLSMLAAYLHNQEYTFSSSDTFPSVRNSLDSLRWIDDDKQYERDGAILCWDNLGTDTLRRDPRLYQMLLFGYNRNTDKVQIANNDGTNKVFHVFCPKIISSVEPLHLDPEFQELQRRFLIIQHKKVDGLQIEIESLNDYDFKELPSLFFNFWHDKFNCMNFVSTRNSISRKKWKISETQKTISVDLATIHGLIYGVSSDDSIALFTNYWINTMANQESVSVLETVLTEFMATEFIKLDVMNIRYLQHSAITDYVNGLFKASVITQQETKEVNKVLAKIGYKRSKYGWSKI